MTNSTFYTSILHFFKKDSAAGMMLLFATIAALLVANGPFSEAYHHLMDLKFTIGFPSLMIEHSIHEWINDGLMAIFFLLVGLEIKRELKYGELSSVQSALVPVIAAFSGAALPAFIFWGLNGGTEYMNGWAIPMATDIAFVIGVLAVLGSKVPVWAKVFVTTIAVADDLFAILVIAIFYTEQISMEALGIAGICLLVLLVFNYSKVNKLAPYLIVGLIMWWAVLESGVHSTIAGVALGFAIPTSPGWSIKKLTDYAQEGFELFKQAADENLPVTREQALYHMDETVIHAQSPLHRLEHKLHNVVYFVIMPLFAFANAGLIFNPEVMTQAFSSTLSWGIILGLFFGKQLGIFGATWLLTKLGFSGLADNRETWKVVYGVALLGGIGFTMSLFIADLSFGDFKMLEFSKVGILTGSIVSGLFGYYLLSRAPEYGGKTQQVYDVPEEDLDKNLTN